MKVFWGFVLVLSPIRIKDRKARTNNEEDAERRLTYFQNDATNKDLIPKILSLDEQSKICLVFRSAKVGGQIGENQRTHLQLRKKKTTYIIIRSHLYGIKLS